MRNKFTITDKVIQSQTLSKQCQRIIKDNELSLSLNIFGDKELQRNEIVFTDLEYITRIGHESPMSMQKNEIVFTDLKYSYGIRIQFIFNGKLVDSIEIAENNEEDLTSLVHSIFYLSGFIDSFYEYFCSSFYKVENNEK